MKNNFLKKISLLAMSLVMVFSGFLPMSVYADDGVPDLELASSSKSFSGYYEARFKTMEMSASVTAVYVNDQELTQSDNGGYNLENNSYHVKDAGYGEPIIQFKVSNLTADDVVKFKNANATYVFDVENPSAMFGDVLEKVPTKEDENGGPDDPPQGEELTMEGHTAGMFDISSYYVTLDPDTNVPQVAKLLVNGEEYTKTTSQYSVFGKFFYVGADNKIWLGIKPNDGAIITLKDTADETMGIFEKKSDTEYETKDNNGPVAKELKVRIKGYFEAAVVGQKGYDAVSSATGSATVNKNSNVVVEVAEVDPGETVTEDQWTLYEDSGMSFPSVTPEISGGNQSGMTPMWNPYESAVTLSGIPANEGEYQVKINVEDDSGRTAESNTLVFEVYDWETVKLSDVLLEEDMTPLPFGGKKQWDMKPWRIQLFDQDEKEAPSTVTVPKDLKLWWGSHESGVYGALGYPMSLNMYYEPNQTLVVPDGCELNLCNMKIYSSVNILVQDGGKLNLHDSALFGKVTVESGGKFQMNYDSHNNEYLTGSSINGQVILEDGAILEDSLIYSNANYLTDGAQAHKIDTPVVKVSDGATVQVNGKVYVRGDEAPTGTSPATGRPYTGQPAFELGDNATLQIPQDSVLGVYGGGKTFLSTIGGDGLIMNEGSVVEGQGKLIAVGGDGHMAGEGGNGISGTGTVNVKEAFLEGGNVYNNDFPPGKPYTENITISGETIGYANDGEVSPNTYEEEQNSPYWTGTQAPSDLVLNNSSTEGAPFIIQTQEYTITANAGDHGTIDPEGTVTVVEGEDQSFTITPDEGYHIKDVKVDDVSVGAQASYDFTDMDGNHIIMAEFEEDEPVVVEYLITSGADQELVEGNQGEPIVIDGDFDHFLGVWVDGEEIVMGTDYTAVSGSTIVTFSQSFLDSLTVGAHQIQIKYDNGMVATQLTIREKDSNNGSHNGENTGIHAAKNEDMSGKAGSVTKVNGDAKDHSAKTGDGWAMEMGLLLLALSGVSLLALRKKGISK